MKKKRREAYHGDSETATSKQHLLGPKGSFFFFFFYLQKRGVNFSEKKNSEENRILAI